MSSEIDNHRLVYGSTSRRSFPVSAFSTSKAIASYSGLIGLAVDSSSGSLVENHNCFIPLRNSSVNGTPDLLPMTQPVMGIILH